MVLANVFVLLALVVPVAALPGQECASTVPGGLIQAGTYNGWGATCALAIHNLRAQFGISNPICDGCPPGENGCQPSTSIDNDNGEITYALDCEYDEDNDVYFFTAVVHTTARWSKHCSPCIGNP